MLYEQPEPLETLRHIAHSLTSRSDLWDDLWQVGWICLWRTEAAEPDQTLSYYLHRCKLRMLDELRSGHSIDSPRRQHFRSQLPSEGGLLRDGAGLLSGLDSDPCGCAAFRDLVEQVVLELAHERDREIFAYLALGWTVGEVALEFDISTSAVSQRRALIALCVVALGPRRTSRQSSRLTVGRRV